jgi:hypothetical protein
VFGRFCVILLPCVAFLGSRSQGPFAGFATEISGMDHLGVASSPQRLQFSQQVFRNKCRRKRWRLGPQCQALRSRSL